MWKPCYSTELLTCLLTLYLLQFLNYFLCKFYSLKSWVNLSQFLSMIFSFSDELVILSYIWESWWRRIAWQSEGQYDAIRKQDSSEDMVNNSSNFLTVICCVLMLQVKFDFRLILVLPRLILNFICLLALIHG